MKKVLSFVLVLAMILGSVATVFAAPYTGVETVIDATNTAVPFADAQDNYMATILRDLGAVDGDGTGNVNPTGELTRAEGYAFIVKAMGLKDLGEVKQATKFSDVKKDDWFSGYVAVAAAQKFTNGTGNGKFSPDAKMSVDEAAAAILKVLGFEDAHLVGAWPANYRDLALAEGILGTVKLGTQTATRADMIQLIYNALNKSIVVWSESKSLQGKEGYTAPANGLVLYQKMTGQNIKNPQVKVIGGSNGLFVGTADANGDAYTLSAKPVVLTSGSVTFSNKYDASAYYGKSVYLLKKGAAYIGVAKLGTTTLTGKFSKNSTVAGFTADGVVYTGLTVPAIQYINGGLTPDAITVGALDYETTYTFEVALNPAKAGNVLTTYSISFEHVDDVQKITATQVALFATDNLYEYTKSSEGIGKFATTDNGVRLNQVLDTKTCPLTVEGAATKLSELEANDVVEIYYNYATETITKIVATRNVVTAPLTRYVNGVCTIEGKEYEVNALATPSTDLSVQATRANAIHAASEYAFYLDSQGKVAFAKLVKPVFTPTYRYALVLEASSKQTPVWSDKTFMTVVTNSSIRLLPLDTMVEEKYEYVSAAAMNSTGNALTADSWDTGVTGVTAGALVKFSVKDGDLYTIATQGSLITNGSVGFQAIANVTFGATNLSKNSTAVVPYATNVKFYVVGANTVDYTITQAGYYAEYTAADLNKSTATALYSVDKYGRVDKVIVTKLATDQTPVTITVAAITGFGEDVDGSVVYYLEPGKEVANKTASGTAIGDLDKSKLYKFTLKEGKIVTAEAVAYTIILASDVEDLDLDLDNNVVVSGKAVQKTLSDAKFMTCTLNVDGTYTFANIDASDVNALFDSKEFVSVDFYTAGGVLINVVVINLAK